MAALLGVATLIGCGTGRTASGNKTIVAENRTSDKEASTPSADTCLNTKLRLRYFYEEAAKQQALGNYDDAYMLLLHCKRIDPNAAEVHYALSNYDESLNSKEMAIADIKRAAFPPVQKASRNFSVNGPCRNKYLNRKTDCAHRTGLKKYVQSHPGRSPAPWAAANTFCLL